MSTINNQTDNALMQRMVAGDKSALSHLYARHAAAALSLALRITQDQHLAEDIVQETFVRIWQKGAQFEAKRGAFRSWMFAITQRLSIDALRRQRVRPQAGKETAVSDQLATHPDPQSNVNDLVWQTQMRQQIKTAIATLPPEQSQIVQLSYFGGYTRREIAKKMNSPVGTVHTRARLALKSLATMLQSPTASGMILPKQVTEY